ncbi:MAG: hypothetical protein LBT56_00020 [Prevotellaceae bacterium]|jgi:hypothetical protein|nr:hypothetical protein [Prevotellaceae bacterium]
MTGILTDSENGDLLIKNGTIALGDITSQVVENVLIANRGEYKECPLVGGEIDKMRNGKPDTFWYGQFKDMLKYCLVKITKLDVENGDITIEW